jgi:nuclear protein localization family protein 4
VQDRKHESFDSYLTTIIKKCNNPSQVRLETMKFDVSAHRYTVDKTCKMHPPYPAGSCQRCIPNTVNLKRQEFRHLDYVSFMNFKELNKFVNHWKSTGCLEQRCAYLFGYYSEDPNYPEGVRVNVEAIYDPPQIAEMGGFIELDDQHRYKADLIAESLGLELVGQMFTKIDQETFLNAEEVKRAARLQQ